MDQTQVFQLSIVFHKLFTINQYVKTKTTTRYSCKQKKKNIPRIVRMIMSRSVPKSLRKIVGGT